MKTDTKKAEPYDVRFLWESGRETVERIEFPKGVDRWDFAYGIAIHKNETASPGSELCTVQAIHKP